MFDGDLVALEPEVLLQFGLPPVRGPLVQRGCQNGRDAGLLDQPVQLTLLVVDLAALRVGRLLQGTTVFSL